MSQLKCSFGCIIHTELKLSLMRFVSLKDVATWNTLALSVPCVCVCGGGGGGCCSINRAGVHYFQRLWLLRKFISKNYKFFFAYMHVFFNHQIRKCANKYVRDRLQCLRSSKICRHFPVRAQTFYSQPRKPSELVICSWWLQSVLSVFQKGLRSGFAICKQNLSTLEWPHFGCMFCVLGRSQRKWELGRGELGYENYLNDFVAVWNILKQGLLGSQIFLHQQSNFSLKLTRVIDICANQVSPSRSRVFE